MNYFILAITFILSFVVGIFANGIFHWPNGDIVFAIAFVGGFIINRLDEYHYNEYEEKDE